MERALANQIAKAGTGFMMSMTEALEKLKSEGYTEEFTMKSNCLECSKDKLCISPDDFNVDETYRFDESSDAADQSILYAISSEKYGVKGVMIDGYGIYSEELTNEMMQRLRATH